FEDAGIWRRTSDDNSLFFRHRLFHELFIALHLTGLPPSAWQPDVFDLASRRRSAKEPLVLAAELLSADSGGRLDAFLMAAWDWSYLAVTESLIELARLMPSAHVSPELEEMVVLK